MLKSKSIHKLAIFFSIVLVVVGLLLTGIGFGMNKGDVSFLKEEDGHKWYQIIGINKNGIPYAGVSFGNKLTILNFGEIGE